MNPDYTNTARHKHELEELRKQGDTAENDRLFKKEAERNKSRPIRYSRRGAV